MCENPVAEMTGLTCSIKLLSKKGCAVMPDSALFFMKIDAQHMGPKFHESQKAKYICQIDEENMA